MGTAPPLENSVALSQALPARIESPALIPILRRIYKEAGYDALDLYLAGLLTTAALALYLRFPTRCYVLEGLARAIPIELGHFQRLLLGNYLLYGVMGHLFYHLLHTLGVSVHAYVALQLMDSLIGALGLSLFYLILRALGSDRTMSFVWTAILACSLGYWMWSTEAENYILSTFLLQVNFLLLILHYKTRRLSPWLLGIAEAFAVFGHLVNGIFVMVAIWFLISTYSREWPKAFLKYAAACAATVSAGFGMALILLRPEDRQNPIGWILGSAGGPAGKIRWHGDGWTDAGFLDWLKMTSHIFISYSERLFTAPPAWPYAGLLLKGAAVLLIFFIIRGGLCFKELWRRHKIAVGACVVWILSYGAIFTSWEPNTMVYRVSDLIPLTLLLAIACQALLRNSIGRLCAILLLAALALGNFGAEIYPRSFWKNNPSWVFMQFIKSSTEGGAWVAGNSPDDTIDIPYFAERRPLVLSSFRDQPELLKTVLARIGRLHQNVYVPSPVLADDFWKDFFTSYTLEKRSGDHAGRTLYRMKAI